MESLKICIHYNKKSNRGFTLVEALIVLSMFVVLVALSLFIDLNNYRGDAFRAQRNALVTALQTARGDALNNIDNQPHGVAINPSGYSGGLATYNHPQSYVIFEGSSYEAAIEDPNNILQTKLDVIDETYSVDISQDSPKEIIFCELSGDAVSAINSGTTCDNPENYYDGKITMTDPQRGLSFTISINHEGRISW